jgi:hypothetical protein
MHFDVHTSEKIYIEMYVLWDSVRTHTHCRMWPYRNIARGRIGKVPSAILPLAEIFHRLSVPSRYDIRQLTGDAKETSAGNES